MILSPDASMMRSVFVALLPTSLLAVCLYVIHRAGGDVVYLVRDPSVTEHGGIWDGAVSNLGVALMAFGAMTILIRASQRKALGSCSIGLGLWMLLFALDDGLLIHEMLGRFEIVMHATYAVLLLALHQCFARNIGVRLVWPLALAFIAFAASSVLDNVTSYILGLMGLELSTTIKSASVIVEDLAKFAGIVLMCALAVGIARRKRA